MLLISTISIIRKLAIGNNGIMDRYRKVTIQFTSDLSDSGVKSAHIHLYTARFFLVLEQIRGNLNSYE